VDATADRIAALHYALVDERDDRRRARIHLELAGLCVAAGNLEHAARHFREALLFEPTLHAAREGLANVAERSRTGSATRPPSRARGLFERLRRAVG
jgi:hypothetical protein